MWVPWAAKDVSLTRHAGQPYTTSRALLEDCYAKLQLGDAHLHLVGYVLAHKIWEGFRDRPVRTCASAAGAEGDNRG